MLSGDVKNWLSHFPDNSEFRVILEAAPEGESNPMMKEILQVVVADGTATTFPQLP